MELRKVTRYHIHFNDDDVTQVLVDAARKSLGIEGGAVIDVYYGGHRIDAYVTLEVPADE